MACYLSLGTRFLRILHYIIVVLINFLTATSNNNVTHSVIVRPKFSNVYNMSYAQVKYSDEESKYVSSRTTVICVPIL